MYSFIATRSRNRHGSTHRISERGGGIERRSTTCAERADGGSAPVALEDRRQYRRDDERPGHWRIRRHFEEDQGVVFVGGELRADFPDAAREHSRIGGTVGRSLSRYQQRDAPLEQLQVEDQPVRRDGDRHEDRDVGDVVEERPEEVPTRTVSVGQHSRSVRGPARPASVARRGN